MYLRVPRIRGNIINAIVMVFLSAKDRAEIPIYLGAYGYG